MPRIMFVDNDADLRLAVKLSFEAEGHDLVDFETSSGFKSVFLQGRPDVVVLDAELSDASGLEVCRWIRRRSACQIIMFTGHSESSFVKQALQAGASDYVLKSSSIDVLIERVTAKLAVATSLRAADARRVVFGGATDEFALSLKAAIESLSWQFKLVMSEEELMTEIEANRPDSVVLDSSIDGASIGRISQLLKSAQPVAGIPLLTITRSGMQEVARRCSVYSDRHFYRPCHPNHVLEAILLLAKQTTRSKN